MKNVYSITDSKFKKYGQIIENIDISKLYKIVDDIIITDEIFYVKNYDEFENDSCFNEFKKNIYNNNDIQIGYCIGKNNNINDLEYHENSEINIALKDMLVTLGSFEDIKADYTISRDLLDVFFVQKGTIIEIYGKSLHFAPCSIDHNGYFSVVVLPIGTNDELDDFDEINIREQNLIAKDKWLVNIVN